LNAAGYEVEAAGSGRDVLERLDLARHAVVVIDANMPDLSGLEVCRAIKDRAGGSNVTVIIVSGACTPSPNYVQRCAQAAGGDHFLRKPYDGAKLVELVAAACKPRLAPAAAGA